MPVPQARRAASTLTLAARRAAYEDALKTARSDASLPASRLLAYAAPAAGVGLLFFLVNLYLLKFATDVLLVAPGALGLLFGASRIWDAIADPLAGYWSDGTRSRFGRRRPWILASLVPTTVTFLMLFGPPASLSGSALVAWLGVGIFGFYTATTIFSVPHTALGAELSTSYDERNRVFGWRQLAFNAGAFVAVAGMSAMIASDAPRETAWQIALVSSLVTAPLLVWCVAGLRERVEYAGRGATNPFGAVRDVWRNSHARLLLVVILIEHLGSATIAILTPYLSEYVLHTPDKTWLYIFLYMLGSTITVPLWIRLATRFGKKDLWVFSMVVAGLAFGGMFFGGSGDVALIATLSFFGGTANGCGAVISQSIKADVIDYDEWQTGERKEGAYFAAWSFVFKGSGGITMMITGVVLQMVGFEPNIEQSDDAKLAMRTLFAIFPLVCYAAGAVLMMRFGLNRAEHAWVRAQIDARRMGAT